MNSLLLLLLCCSIFGCWGWAENRTFSANKFSVENIERLSKVDFNENEHMNFVDGISSGYGSAWWINKMQSRGFQTNFTMKLDKQSDSSKYDIDGLSFVITTDKQSRGPNNGDGSIGYGNYGGGVTGIHKSFAIEFDSYKNDDPINDPDGGHLSLHVAMSGKTNYATEGKISCPLGDDGCTVTSASLDPFVGYSVDVSIRFLPKGGDQPTNLLVVSYKRSTDDTMVDRLTISDDRIDLMKFLEIDSNSDSLAYIGLASSSGPDQTTQKLIVYSWSFKFLGETSPKYSRLDKPTVTKMAGEDGSFVIQAYDQFDYKMITGGESFQVTGKDSSNNPIQFSVADQGNGKYIVSYNIKKAGQISASVTMTKNGKQQPSNGGDKVSLQIDPNVPSSGATKVISGDIDGKTFVAGVDHQFKIQLVDQYGNDVTTFDNSQKGSLGLKVSYDGNDGEEPNFSVETGNGILEVTWSNTKAGSHKMSISIGGKPISNSDHSFKIEPAAPEPKESKIIGEVPTQGKTGLKNVIKVQLYDTFGNAATNFIASKEDISFTVKNNDLDLNVEVEPLQSGQIQVSFEAMKVDHYQMHLSYKDYVIVNNQDIDIVTSGDISPPQCTAAGEGLNSTKVGDLAEIKVTLMDSGSNPTGGTGQNPGFGLIFTSTKNPSVKYNSRDVRMKVLPVEDGIATINYNLTKAGDFQLIITMNATEITTPEEGYWSIHAEAGVGYGPNSEVKDMPRETRTGETQNFKLVTLDRFQNVRPNGGDDVKIQMTQANDKVKFQVVDNKDSTYSLSYSMDSTGEYDLYISVNGQQIKESPFKVKCSWAGLSTGAILAIAFGVIAFLGIAAAAVWVWKKKFAGKRLYQRIANQEPETLT